jgi:polysaccharide biosynthesis/export protein
MSDLCSKNCMAIPSSQNLQLQVSFWYIPQANSSRTWRRRWLSTSISVACGLGFGVGLNPAFALPANLDRQPLLAQAVLDRSDSEAAYALGAGDRIRIDVFRVTQYSGENIVLVDGTLNLPVAGNVYVQGMTLQQAEAAISNQYARFLRRPIVTITLLAPRPVKVGVAGEVKHPGFYTLNPNSGETPTLAQVLESAGGIRQSANLRQVEIRRQNAGGEEIITVNLWQFLQTGDLSYNLTLRDGDSIFVPTAATVDLAESSQLAAASFAADETTPLNIAVVGEVFRPGPYTVAGSAQTAEAGVPGGTTALGTAPTVTRAIQVAGGITPTANIRGIQIRRNTRDGSQQTIPINLWQLLEAGDLRQDIILQEGDTIFVPTATAIEPTEAAEIAAASFSPNSIRVNVVGEVVRPGTIEVPPNTPLNQAVLSAGGFNTRANQSIELIRLNANGTISRQEVDVNFAQNPDTTGNPTLRNNDVIIVKRSGLASISDALGTAADPIGRFFTLFSIPLNFFRLF